MWLFRISILNITTPEWDETILKCQWSGMGWEHVRNAHFGMSKNPGNSLYATSSSRHSVFWTETPMLKPSVDWWFARGLVRWAKKTQCSSQICQPCLIQHRRVTHQSWTNHWDLMCVYIYTIICLCSIYVYTYIHTFILGFPIINKSSSNHQSIIN